MWLIVYTVGLPVQILKLRSDDFGSEILFIAFMLFIISSYTSSIVAVVWVSIIKRSRFLGIIENILDVDNKLRYTLQEETSMNRNVLFNIISEIILLTVIRLLSMIYNIYRMGCEPYYNIFKVTFISVFGICNILHFFAIC
jgi:hypothetical protein